MQKAVEELLRASKNVVEDYLHLSKDECGNITPDRRDKYKKLKAAIKRVEKNGGQ